MREKEDLVCKNEQDHLLVKRAVSTTEIEAFEPDTNHSPTEFDERVAKIGDNDLR